MPLTIETVFGTIVSILLASFWYWVKGLAASLKEAQRERGELRDQLHQVMLDYKTKAEAHADRETISRSLERIEEKIDKLAERKADR